MCARIFYLALAALFVYLVVTVAAFVYLEWWQALIVSAATFVLEVYAGKLLVRYAVRHAVGRVGEMAKGLFDTKSKVLRGATVDVHKVRSAEPPPELLRAAEDPDADEFDRAEAAAELRTLNWYEVEATIFPDPGQGGPMTHWDLDDLRLVPSSATPPTPLQPSDDAEEFTLHGAVLVQNGEPVTPVDTKLLGPQRLRFTVGVPRNVRELTFRYYFEQFGLVRLSAGPALRAPTPG